LPGSKIANRLHTNFYLVNLVLQEKETPIESFFKKHIKESSDRTFLSATWEEMYRYIENKGIANRDKEVIIKYFTEKTVGYDRKGKLQKAFNLNPPVC
jgi:TnpA family transposase